MNRTKTILLIFLFFIGIYSFSQEEFLFVGKVIDNQTNRVIQYTHVVNLKTNKGGLTNRNGFFFQKVTEGDYLKLSFMGYNTYYYQVRNTVSDTITFLLARKVYELEDIDVYPWTIKEFKHKFVYTNFDADSIDWLLKKILVPKSELLAIHNFKPFIAIPVFSNFKTKKEKQIVRLEELKRWIKKEERYREMVAKVTGYRELELNKFIKYCNFSKRYISYARSYYLTSAIEKKYTEYQKSKK